MDRLLRVEVVQTVKKAVEEAMLVYEERWLTPEQISEHVGTMTPRWLKDHGHLFDEIRTRMEWKNPETGKVTTGQWLYPLHKIEQMIATGEIKQLVG